MIQAPSPHSAVIATDSDIGIAFPIRDKVNSKMRIVGNIRQVGEIGRQGVGEDAGKRQGERRPGHQAWAVGGVQHLDTTTRRAGGPDIELEDNGLETHRGGGDIETGRLGPGALLGKTSELQGKISIRGRIARSCAGGGRCANTPQDRQ